MINTKEFIAKKIAQFVSFVDTEQNPIFVITATIVGMKGKLATVKLTPYFFSDSEKEMNKEQKMVLLNFLEEFVKEEKKLLKKKKVS